MLRGLGGDRKEKHTTVSFFPPLKKWKTLLALQKNVSWAMLSRCPFQLQCQLKQFLLLGAWLHQGLELLACWICQTYLSNRVFALNVFPIFPFFFFYFYEATATTSRVPHIHMQLLTGREDSTRLSGHPLKKNKLESIIKNKVCPKRHSCNG